MTSEPIVKLVSHLIHSTFIENTPVQFETIINKLTNQGSLILPNNLLELINFTIPVIYNGNFYGNFSVGILYIKIDGLETWKNIEITTNDKQTIFLNSEIEKIKVELTISITTTDGLLSILQNLNKSNITVLLANNKVNGTLQLSILENTFNSLGAEQFLGNALLQKKPSL